MTETAARPPHVVIIGGGFGGLYCARALRRAGVRITLVDRQNYHLFQPLLYQVATASLSPGDVASPIREMLRRQRDATVLMDEALGVDLESRRVRLRARELSYDYLVIATGVTHAYFGHPEWAPLAPGLKTVDDALEIRRRFLVAYEMAEREPDEALRRLLLTQVIVGAGPTGVELAGAMAEIANRVLPDEFREIDTRRTRILLLEGSDRVLPTYPPDLSEKARRQLERLGVEVRTGAMVTGIEPGRVLLGDEHIEAGNVFWAAGVAASPVGAALGVPLDRAGRVPVRPDCSITGHPEVFVIGDLARFEQDGRVLPGVAQVAIQMARHVAGAIRADRRGRPRKTFRYRDKGNLATIGRAAAVAELGRVHLSGFIAWITWIVVHILFLIGFRNRLIVMIQWAWAYFAYRWGPRIITGGTALPSLEARAEAGAAAASDERGRAAAAGPRRQDDRPDSARERAAD